MNLVDDDGKLLNADYSCEADGPYIAVILKSRSGKRTRPYRNADYDEALCLLLARLGALGARLVDGLVDTENTQRDGLPEAMRSFIESPIPLALVADVDALRRDIGRKVEGISRAPNSSGRGGERRKRIRLRVDVPDYQPDYAEQLEDILATPAARTSGKPLASSGGTQVEEKGGEAAAGHAGLDWVREEIILAMDLYVAAGAFDGGPIPGQRSSDIIQLSRLLRQLSAYPKKLQGNNYRKPGEVYLKMMDLHAIQTDDTRGMSADSQVDAMVWQEFADDLPRLREEAEAIRVLLSEGAIQPAGMWPRMEDVNIEQQHTEAYVVNPSGEPRAAERAEQNLVIRYRDYMAAKGIVVGRKRYWPVGEVRPIYSDAWVEDRYALIEAKNSDGRDAIRQAIGQLYDYRRFHKTPIRLAVLFPYRPEAERLDLLRSAGIEALWPEGAGFLDSADGAFI
jgi:hypothetical protein